MPSTGSDIITNLKVGQSLEEFAINKTDTISDISRGNALHEQPTVHQYPICWCCWEGKTKNRTTTKSKRKDFFQMLCFR